MVELRWEGDEKSQSLFAGQLLVELAWLAKRKKLWSAAVFLPGVWPGREYNTLAAHKRDIEEAVRHWFEQAERGGEAPTPVVFQIEEKE